MRAMVRAFSGEVKGFSGTAGDLIEAQLVSSTADTSSQLFIPPPMAAAWGGILRLSGLLLGRSPW
jgi:hypothetical protein